MDKRADTAVPIHDLIASRWSPRALSRKEVSQEDITALLEAARWAPSSYNMQPWRFMVWQRAVNAEAFQKAFDAMVPFNQGWVEPASLLIGVFTHTLTPKGEVNRIAPYDAGAAAYSLVLQAHAMGLFAHQMSGIEPAKLRDAFKIPDDVEVLTMIAIGHPGPVEALSDPLREREMQRRERKPISEIAYSSTWGNGFEAVNQG